MTIEWFNEIPLMVKWHFVKEGKIYESDAKVFPKLEWFLLKSGSNPAPPACLTM